MLLGVLISVRDPQFVYRFLALLQQAVAPIAFIGRLVGRLLDATSYSTVNHGLKENDFRISLLPKTSAALLYVCCQTYITHPYGAGWQPSSIR